MASLCEETLDWASEVIYEQEVKTFIPPSTNEIRDRQKIITEYRLNDEEKLERIVRVYNIEKRRILESAVKRKNFSKFGDAKNDISGPNTITAVLAEEVKLQLIRPEDDNNNIGKLNENKSAIRCRHCDGVDHFTVNCPYKGLVDEKIDTNENASGVDPSTATEVKTSSGYVIPACRSNASDSVKQGKTLNQPIDLCTVRISNLSESVTEDDLKDLITPFGTTSRVFLRKDKHTGNCLGYAYVTYTSREYGLAAIKALDGYGYDYLILRAELAITK